MEADSNNREAMLAAVKRVMPGQPPYGLALEGLAACAHRPTEFPRERL